MGQIIGGSSKGSITTTSVGTETEFLSQHVAIMPHLTLYR